MFISIDQLPKMIEFHTIIVHSYGTMEEDICDLTPYKQLYHPTAQSWETAKEVSLLFSVKFFFFTKDTLYILNYPFLKTPDF